MNLIVATARSRNVVTLCVASTAIAAHAYPGGRTAHSMFNIPVPDAASSNANSRKIDCAIDEASTHAEFLRQVRLIIWDEVLNSHRYDIEAVDRMLR
eukprot:SAG31_NODE_32133_length_359_cov_1.388462_1_plen_96_part_01